MLFQQFVEGFNEIPGDQIGVTPLGPKTAMPVLVPPIGVVRQTGPHGLKSFVGSTFSQLGGVASGINGS